jgi:hypothetical protein
VADTLAEMETRAAEMDDYAIMRISAISAAAAPWDPEREVLPCPRCTIPRFALELQDTSGIPEAGYPYLCGGCLGDLHRAGTLPRSVAARKLGAPAGLVVANERAEDRRRAQPARKT